MSGASQTLATFRLGPHRLGIDVGLIQEVVVGRTVTPVPVAPPVILGLLNLRGQIVTVLDLARRLELPDVERVERPALYVLRHGRSPVALAVERPDEVVEVSEAAFEHPPETMPEEVRDLIPGAYALEEGLVLVLDLGRVLDVAVDRRAGTVGPDRSVQEGGQT